MLFSRGLLRACERGSTMESLFRRTACKERGRGAGRTRALLRSGGGRRGAATEGSTHTHILAYVGGNAPVPRRRLIVLSAGARREVWNVLHGPILPSGLRRRHAPLRSLSGRTSACASSFLMVRVTRSFPRFAAAHLGSLRCASLLARRWRALRDTARPARSASGFPSPPLSFASVWGARKTASSSAHARVRATQGVGTAGLARRRRGRRRASPPAPSMFAA